MKIYYNNTASYQFYYVVEAIESNFIVDVGCLRFDLRYAEFFIRASLDVSARNIKKPVIRTGNSLGIVINIEVSANVNATFSFNIFVPFIDNVNTEGKLRMRKGT